MGSATSTTTTRCAPDADSGELETLTTVPPNGTFQGVAGDGIYNLDFNHLDALRSLSVWSSAAILCMPFYDSDLENYLQHATTVAATPAAIPPAFIDSDDGWNDARSAHSRGYQDRYCDIPLPVWFTRCIGRVTPAALRAGSLYSRSKPKTKRLLRLNRIFEKYA